MFFKRDVRMSSSDLCGLWTLSCKIDGRHLVTARDKLAKVNTIVPPYLEFSFLCLQLPTVNRGLEPDGPPSDISSAGQ